MAVIILADDGVPFDGTSPDTGPLGGAEAAVIGLLEGLAARGHTVTAYTRCAQPVAVRGVAWRSLGDGLPRSADLYIANRAHHLIAACPGARRQMFWVHNPASYLLKLRYLLPLWRVKPVIVFSGAYHARTYPAWAPAGGRKIVPYGLPDVFRQDKTERSPPAPVAIFTSNPLRGLDGLLDLWADHIHPALPQARFLVHSGLGTYRGGADRHRAAMEAVLAKAQSLTAKGVICRDPLPRAALIPVLKAARLMLYSGDVGETFCLAVGEAQALGLPAVVRPIGSLPERVRDGQTGFVAADDAAMAARAIALLSDDALWSAQHRAALAFQGGWGWDQAAAEIETLLMAR
jgi:glycosyltransferase involved in cell wall biosynthesis